MKRFVFALALSFACAFLAAVRAEDAPAFGKISEHVWAYTGAKDASPANSYRASAGVVVGEKEALVVDTLISAKEGKRLLADIRKVTDKPIRWIVNTHYHLDHAWGNCAFADEGATVVGAEPARELANKEGVEVLANYAVYGLTAEQIEGTAIVPAALTFSGAMKIDLGGLIVELRALTHGHSRDNLVVWVEKNKTLLSGDLLFVGCHPFMGEGNLQNWLKNLDTLRAFGAEKIVPGHGPVSSAKDIDDMVAYIKAFDEQGRALCAGKSAADAPALAEELLKKLPSQNRTELMGMVASNLTMLYLQEKKN